MKTPVVSRRQEGPVPEMEEIIPAHKTTPDKIYVAVGKDISESVNALKWALLNLENRQAAIVILLHIQLPIRYMPSPMGRIPKNQVSEDVLKAYEKDVEKELNNCMKKYLDICTRAKVKAEALVVEKDDVSKGIVEVVSEQGITKLIMGTTSAGAAISKKMKMQAPGKADYVQKHAIDSCDVSIVCKGKLVFLRERSTVHNDAAPNSKGYRNSLSDWLRKRPETSTIEPFLDDSGRSASSLANIRRDLDNCNKTPSIFRLDRECTPAWAEEVNEPGFETSLEITAAIDQLSAELEAAMTPQIDPDKDYPHNNVDPHSQASQEAIGDTETLKLQLRDALEVAENAKKEVRMESFKRKKAEAAAMKSIHKFKDLEDAMKAALKEKEDAILYSRVIEQKYQDIWRRRNEAEEEVQAMVEKLTSFATKLNQFSRERQEAIHELEAARQKLAAMETQNHSILQQKDAEIKHLQDCLHSRPPIESPTSSSSNTLEFHEYTWEDIKSATCNFSDNSKLGGRGYGTVYKGEIRQSAVAVKILKVDTLQSRHEFQREIDILRDIRHPHLVRVVGACFERGCILYEYMSNGSLADRLSCKNATPPLPWHVRIRIAAEFCSALQYLHSLKPEPIVHRDLKPENILLDDDYVTKITDFGLALLQPEDLHNKSDPKGTFPHTDPECPTSGEYSTKSDVYSLGVVILQLLTGKPALGLVKEVELALESATLDQILDPSAGEWPLLQATQLADLALHCTEPIREKRPDLHPTVMKSVDQFRNFAVGTLSPGMSLERGKKLVQAPEEIHVPSFFLCPIFKEVMQYPFVAADGFTYEKEAIQGWLDCGRDTSPMTNKKLVRKSLIANHSLRSAIRQWQERGELL